MRLLPFIAAILTGAVACGGSAGNPVAPSTTTTTTAAATAATTSTQVTTRSWTAVRYATSSSTHVMDITLPATGNGPFPVVVFIHGGGFSSGSRTANVLERAQLVDAGYAVATIDYRLSGEAKFPAQIHDVKAAIRYLKANASTYALNSSRFATMGTSAGAGLAALAGVSAGVTALEDLSLGNAMQTSRVQAFVDFYGPIDFLTMDAQLKQLGFAGGINHDAADSPESELIGAAIQIRPDLCNAYSPQSYISADDPPAFIQHGTADTQIPYLQGQTFATKLSAVIGAGSVKWSTIPGAGHGDPLFHTPTNMTLVVAFLDQYLK